jgi:membrane protein implicated in regulation of membrane protease activity
MRMPIARLVPAVLRHLEAYADVAGEDARDAAGVIARHLLALLIAAAAGFIALLMFCAWILVLAWDTPWRAWVAAGLALGFAILAAALAVPALRHGGKPHEVFFPRMRDALARDRELLDRAFDDNGRSHATNGGEEHAANRN